SMSGSLLSTLAMNVPSALMSLGNSGNAASTTYAAVSDGTLLLRDTAKQVQDITTLSRDVEHANNALSPIFNKEKEQKRLKQAQLIGEIGAQVMDIVRTEGELKAQKAAEAKGDSKVKRPQDGDSVAMWEDYKKALTESPTYKAEMQKYGTGSDFQRAAQAATAAIQALAGGDIQKAIASGASPYLAQLVKDVTIPKDESKITASDIAANAMAHAVVGAVVAQLSGQDAAAGAIGASSGELIARAIMADQYPGKTANDLTEEEKQSVSALSTLASGLVSGLAGNSTASAASGAQSGRNAVENNFFGPNGMPKGMTDVGMSMTSLYTNTNLLDENGNVLNPITEEERQYAMHKLITGTIPEGQDPVRGLLIAWGAGASVVVAPVFLPSMLSAGTIIGGGAISGTANISNQLMRNGPFSYTDALIATGAGAVTQGRGFWFTEVVSVAGAYTGAKLQNKDPLTASIAAGIGTAVGAGGGKVIEVGNKYFPVVSDKTANMTGIIGGALASEAAGSKFEDKVGNSGESK
ncbi:VENN motif pre-toxin domain-containing protein, partial [Pectobacterium odoriferum]